MLSYRTCLVMLFFLLLPSISVAAPLIYPVKAVFGIDLDRFTQKAPSFSKWIKSTKITSNQNGVVRFETLANEYDTAFRKVFGELVPQNITRENRHEVLVASLHVIRASEYRVPKAGNDEVHIPITLSVVITNPSTGEAIYSFSKTSYATTLVPRQAVDSKSESLLMEQAANNYRLLLNSLLQEVRKGYSPEKIENTIVKNWKGILILGKGSKFGFAKDDSLQDAVGNEITIKYVTENYSVALPVLGKVENGTKVFKYGDPSTSSLFAKPRVLTMHDAWKEISPELMDVSLHFDAAISKESAFTLLPVNEHFRNMLFTIAKDTNAGQYETTQKRLPPDYIMKYRYATPQSYSIHDSGKFSLNVYEQYVVGELIDMQGRIIYSAVGTNRIDDQNIGGMVFDEKARLEVVLKNAVMDLAEQFTKSIKFSHFVLPVVNVENKIIEVADKAKELRVNQNVLVYHNIGTIDGIAGDVTVPLWEATVVEAQQGKVKLSLGIPFSNDAIAVSDGDMVVIDAITAAASADQSETSVTFCKTPPSKLGSIDIQNFATISHAYDYLLPYTLYDQDSSFDKMLLTALKSGGFNSSSLKKTNIDTAGRCLLPVHKATMEKNVCDKGVCAHEVSLVAGYRLYIGQEVKGKAASSTTIKTEDCNQGCQLSVIHADLSKSTLGLLKDAILKVRYQ